MFFKCPSKVEDFTIHCKIFVCIVCLDLLLYRLPLLFQVYSLVANWLFHHLLVILRVHGFCWLLKRLCFRVHCYVGCWKVHVFFFNLQFSFLILQENVIYLLWGAAFSCCGQFSVVSSLYMLILWDQHQMSWEVVQSQYGHFLQHHVLAYNKNTYYYIMSK